MPKYRVGEKCSHDGTDCVVSRIKIVSKAASCREYGVDERLRYFICSVIERCVHEDTERVVTRKQGDGMLS